MKSVFCVIALATVWRSLVLSGRRTPIPCHTFMTFMSQPGLHLLFSMDTRLHLPPGSAPAL